MGRDGSRTKGRGGGRGGGKKMFIQNVEELQMRDLQVGESREARIRRRAGSDDEGGGGKDDFENIEELDEEDAKESVGAFRPKRAGTIKKENADENDEVEEVETKKMGGLLGGIERSNPNHEKKAERMLKVKDLDSTTTVADPDAGMNRKEREIIEAARKKEEYQRRHMAGETEGAQREIAQLAIVKARREAAAKLREAEGRKPGMSKQGIEEESESDSSDDDSDDDDSDDDAADKKKPAAKVKPSSAQLSIAAKKRAAAAGDEVKVEVKSAGKADKSAGPEKLKTMDIKKMSGDMLKDHLKERKLDLQGQKKDLIQRLLDYEAARA